MSKPPVKVLVAVTEEHMPLVDALHRLCVDVGSVGVEPLRRMLVSPEALALVAELDPAARFICVATASPEDMVHTMERLADELAPVGYTKLGRVVLFAGPLDTMVAAFVDVVVLQLHEH